MLFTSVNPHVHIYSFDVFDLGPYQVGLRVRPGSWLLLLCRSSLLGRGPVFLCVLFDA